MTDASATQLRRELELAGLELSQAGQVLLAELRESHVGDSWMWEEAGR